ncbi:MAG: serine hydrolase domain-containing protein [Saprospiraceae bacterium]|nr:beta-lactamase family protein [Saprospiraceae bacterium]
MKRIIIPIFICTLFIVSAISQPKSINKPGDKSTKIDELMSYCHENGLFNGTILVSEKNKVIYKEAFGMANKEKEQPLTIQSSFYLCSVSKQFTAMAIMILKQKNKLSYDDKLSKYFVEFPSYANDVTIRHLMTHTSGIPDHYRLGAYKKGLKNADVFSLLIKQDTLDFAPGSKYSYSNGGYVLLAMIVEKVSKQPFHIFMKENIFKPLGMKNTLVFDESKPEIKNRVIGYNASGNPDDYELFTTGAGGVFSTVDDLFLWNQSLFTNKPISQKTLADAFKTTTLNDGSISNYGFGWVISDRNGKKIVRHSGSLVGFRTFIERNITDRYSWILLTNSGDAVPMNEINGALDSIMNNATYNLPKVPASSKLHRHLKDSSHEVAESFPNVVVPSEIPESSTGKYSK